MLRQKPVVRTLFKSLLKFVRRSELQQLTHLNIHPRQLGIEHLLPADVANLPLHTAQDAQGALFLAFRTTTATDKSSNRSIKSSDSSSQESINLGFRVLKELNNMGAQWKEEFNAHIARYQPTNAALVKYRVGQVLQHRQLRYRGVVVGWSIDEEKQQQMLQLVVDQLDCNEFTKLIETQQQVPVESRMFAAVQDPVLMRVMNSQLDHHFEGFQEHWQRYIPKPELRMWYAPDFDSLLFHTATSSAAIADANSNNNNHNNGTSSSSSNTSNSDSNTSSSEQQQEEQRFASAVQRVNQQVSSLGRKMQSVLRSSSIYSTTTSSTAATTATNQNDTDSSASINSNIIFHQVLEYVQETVHLCASPDQYGATPANFFNRQAQRHVLCNGNATAAGSSSNGSNKMGDSSNSSEEMEPRHPLWQQLRRGGLYRHNNINNNTNSNNNNNNSSVNVFVPSLRALPSKLFDCYYGGVNERQLERAFYSLGYLANCYNAIDQILSFRFQQHGAAYHEGLFVAPTTTDNAASTTTASSTDTSTTTSSTSTAKSATAATATDADAVATTEDTTVAATAAKDTADHATAATTTTTTTAASAASRVLQHPSSKAVEHWNSKTKLPRIQYEVGEIMRHKQFGYRGVITGVDLRPGFNMSTWEGIVNLQFGQEQPIYRITPDEGDVAAFLGRGQYRNSYYVAQENLERIENPEEKLIEHRTLGDIFLGYDVSRGRFRVPHKLRYCFPSTAASAVTTTTDAESGIDDTAAAVSSITAAATTTVAAGDVAAMDGTRIAAVANSGSSGDDSVLIDEQFDDDHSFQQHGSGTPPPNYPVANAATVATTVDASSLNDLKPPLNTTAAANKSVNSSDSKSTSGRSKHTSRGSDDSDLFATAESGLHSLAYYEAKVHQQQAAAYEEIDRVLVQLLTILRSSFADSCAKYQQQVRDSNTALETGSTFSTAAADQSSTIPTTITTKATTTKGTITKGTVAAATIKVTAAVPSLEMDDIHLLLKHAVSREQALYVESIAWMLSLSHHNADINRLMRLSVATAKRGNMDEAIDITNSIIALDPDFAEPYNKMASYLFYQQNFEKCLQNNDEVLKRFPKHFGSLAGGALSLEQLGDKEKAVDHLRKALQIHPWAAHLPTVLISILKEKEDAEEERRGTPSMMRRSDNKDNSSSNGNDSGGVSNNSGANDSDSSSDGDVSEANDGVEPPK